jgi:hypothetical protein
VDALTVVDAVGYQPATLPGRSRPIVLALADGRLALGKLKGNPQTTHALVADLVTTRLGRLVGAPVPEPLLVHVPSARLRDIPPLRRRRWISGLQYGAVFVGGAAPVRLSDAARLTNLDLLPVAALLEAWIHNTDLKASHLLAAPGPAGDSLLVVDHGHALPGAPRWTPATLAAGRAGLPALSALTALARAAHRPFDFRPGLQACMAVTEAELSELVAGVPPEWRGGPGGPGGGGGGGVGWGFRRSRLPAWGAALSRCWNG